MTRGKSHSTWAWQADGAIIMDATPVGRAGRQKEVPEVMKFPGCETCWGQIMDKQSTRRR